MGRCMICGREREDSELKGRICHKCSNTLQREAGGAKLKEKKAADRDIRASGQTPPDQKKKS